jgi:hypothetical protein
VWRLNDTRRKSEQTRFGIVEASLQLGVPSRELGVIKGSDSLCNGVPLSPQMLQSRVDNANLAL